MLAFSVRQATCGIATGSLDCGLVALTLDGGPLKVIDPSFDAGSTSIHSARLNASKCVVIAPE